MNIDKERDTLITLLAKGSGCDKESIMAFMENPTDHKNYAKVVTFGYDLVILCIALYHACIFNDKTFIDHVALMVCSYCKIPPMSYRF